MDKKAINIVIEEVEKLKQRIADNIVSTGQNASGSTIQSLTIQSSDDSVTLFGRPYFGTLETGRKPGKMPPVSSILDWIKAKPIPVPTKMKDTSFAYAIAKKIANEGTSLYQKGGRNDVYSNEIPNTINSISRKLLGLFTTEIENIPLN